MSDATECVNSHINEQDYQLYNEDETTMIWYKKQPERSMLRQLRDLAAKKRISSINTGEN